jgi:4-amino-4-deoxy-L-arabinose transferase-like glycosyltransferase
LAYGSTQSDLADTSPYLYCCGTIDSAKRKVLKGDIVQVAGNDFSAVRRLRRRSIDAAAVALLLAVVATIYGARLARLPIVGEESRWGTAAREMLSTSDWLVPRQQDHVFAERPPLTIWAIAVTGWLRGEVDSIAVRLPSVIAVVLTTLLIYVYARASISRFAAWSAALSYATMAQVAQIGRMGESEALFALLTGGALLSWHLGYMRRWPPLVTWSLGFGFAALAALVKGPQAPIYFVAITTIYLLSRRDWQYLVSWQTAAGAAIFLAIVAAWQIPFYRATNWQATVSTWTGLTQDRLHVAGLAQHLITFPLETFICLLPWSPILVALASRQARALLAKHETVVTFLLTSLAVAYPTVWIAAGGRGRYFMPLYPCLAVLIGITIDRCSSAALGNYPRRAWHQFLLLCGILFVVSGLAFGTISALPDRWSQTLFQPRWFGIGYGLTAALAGYVLWRCYRAGGERSRYFAVLAISAMVGLTTTGLMINVDVGHWNDMSAAVESLKTQLPQNVKLVSLSPIEHRFAFYFGQPIVELDWPLQVNDVPANVDYFCFMRNPSDTAASRISGRGRSWSTTPGTLPFAWEEVASICNEREVSGDRPRSIVVGRIVRPLRAEVTDATVPKSTMVERRVAARGM